MDTFQGWLGSLLVASEHPDPAPFSVARNYFRGWHITIQSCSGNAQYPHYSLSHTPRFDFHLQAHKDDYALHKGQLQSWLRHRVNVERTPNVRPECWRNTEDYVHHSTNSNTVHRCSGISSVLEVFISLPVVLMIETPLSEGWDYPNKIVLYGKGAKDRPEVVFDLVTRVFHSRSGQHYMCRFTHAHSTSRRVQVARYNDQRNGGLAVLLKDSKPSTHLAGPDSTLKPPLSNGFKTCLAVYRMRGGRETQEQLHRYQLLSLQRNHQITFSSHSLHDIASTRISLQCDNTYVLPERYRLWYSPGHKERQSRIDYDTQPSPSMSSPHPTSHSHTPLSAPTSNNSETSLKAPQALSKPSSDDDPLPGSDVPESDEEPGPLLQRHQSPHPVRCRCGVQGDGNRMTDGLQTIQCDVCDLWSHISCQRDGRANNITRKDAFECDECSGQNWAPEHQINEV